MQRHADAARCGAALQHASTDRTWHSTLNTVTTLKKYRAHKKTRAISVTADVDARGKECVRPGLWSKEARISWYVWQTVWGCSVQEPGQARHLNNTI